jgi:hypothetical protein
MKPCPVAPAERPGDASDLLDRFPLGAAQARAAWVLQPSSRELQKQSVFAVKYLKSLNYHSMPRYSNVTNQRLTTTRRWRPFNDSEDSISRTLSANELNAMADIRRARARDDFAAHPRRTVGRQGARGQARQPTPGPGPMAARMWIVSRVACGLSQATKSTPDSIRLEIKKTLRASRSSLAITRTARRSRQAASAAAICGRPLRLPLSISWKLGDDHAAGAVDVARHRGALRLQTQPRAALLVGRDPE